MVFFLDLKFINDEYICVENVKVQTLKVTKLCKTRDIVTINGMYPGPVVYAQEDDRVIVKVTNETPYNATIHWHGVRQRLSCWSDGPSYITQCPIQSGQTFTYEFTLFQQKGTLRGTPTSPAPRHCLRAIVVYPRRRPYPFPPLRGAHPHPRYALVSIGTRMCAAGEAGSGERGAARGRRISHQRPPRATLQLLGPRLLQDRRSPRQNLPPAAYKRGAEHGALLLHCGAQMTVVEADGEYTKPFATDHLMLARPDHERARDGDRPSPSTRWPWARTCRPELHGAGVTRWAPAQLPAFNNNLVVKTNMDGLRSLNAPASLPLEIDANLLFTVGLNVDKCDRAKPNKTCQGPNGGIFAASMNNVSFVRPTISLLQAYYSSINGHYTEDFPGVPLRAYDFSLNGTKVYVLDYGSRVQLVFQDTGTVTTENHPIHLHGYSFYVVGYGTGNYNPSTAKLNLVDPPYMNTIGVPVGGWAAVRFIADNPGVWFVHCHLEVHMSWGLSMAIIVKNGQGPLETLPHPPSDLPRC
ncbi:Laccase-6 [Ananas comosus]|uniref:Laccase-6 n=1 Tax=Ananas comosus TaxID=4615 RepID=A0A199UZU1_ANACO|nr:Laccase-6 [Ananas comosus]